MCNEYIVGGQRDQKHVHLVSRRRRIEHFVSIRREGNTAMSGRVWHGGVATRGLVAHRWVTTRGRMAAACTNKQQVIFQRDIRGSF